MWDTPQSVETRMLGGIVSHLASPAFWGGWKKFVQNLISRQLKMAWNIQKWPKKANVKKHFLGDGIKYVWKKCFLLFVDITKHEFCTNCGGKGFPNLTGYRVSKAWTGPQASGAPPQISRQGGCLGLRPGPPPFCVKSAGSPEAGGAFRPAIPGFKAVQFE